MYILWCLDEIFPRYLLGSFDLEYQLTLIFIFHFFGLVDLSNSEKEELNVPTITVLGINL